MLRASDEAFFPSIGLVLNLVQTIDALFTRRLSLLQLLYGTTPALPPMEAARAPP